MKKSDVALLRPVLSDNGEINENARAVARLKKTDGRDVVSVSICGLPNRTGGEYYFFLEGNIPPFSGFSILPAESFPFTTATPPGLPQFVM